MSKCYMSEYFIKLKNVIIFIVAVYQLQLWSTHVPLWFCLCVRVHDNSKKDGSIHLKLEHIVIVVFENSYEFDIGHCSIKVKVSA